MTDQYHHPASTVVPEPNQLRLPVGRAEEEVGIQLRQQRLKRRLGLEEAARRIRLTPLALERMEKGELDQLAPIYRRGYVRNYATFLGLDPAPLLELIEQPEPAQLRQVLAVPRRQPKFDRYLKFATYLVVTTLIVPPIVWLYVQGGSRFIEPEPVAGMELAESAPGAVEQRNASRIARALALDDGNDPAESSSGGSAVAASALPLAAIRPLRDPAAAEPDAVAPDSEALEEGLSVLVIDLRADSWLEVYAADGERLEYDLLRAGDRRRFEAKPPFRLLLGRASAIALEVDGQTVEFDGQDRADVTSLELLAGGEVRL